MAQNFIGCDREQELLLPPSLREWLPEEHLAWFVLDAVAEMELGAFYAGYRADGWGRAAHDPAMIVALYRVRAQQRRGRAGARAAQRKRRDDAHEPVRAGLPGPLARRPRGRSRPPRSARRRTGRRRTQ